MFRRVWAGLLSLVLIMGMVAAAPVTASAAMAEEDYSAAAQQLNKYGLVQGDDRGYRFYAQITRAEMAKLLVYALGLQNDASRYVGRGVFSDTQGHWADGVATLAKNVGVMKGYPEGDFRPQAPVTYAEVITALSRLVGLEASAEEWPRTYLQPAARAGIIPDQMNVQAMLSDPANRGDVFVLLWRTLTEVKNAQGQNLLRRYLDTSAPALTVDPQPAETTDPTLTISGTARDAQQVLVNGVAVPVSLGYFRQSVSLRVGPNTIRIQAVDAAGNVKEEAVQVTRKQGLVNALAVTGPAQVQVGQTAAFLVSLQDQNGEPVTDRKGVTADLFPADLGTFDLPTGVFTAGKAPGMGTITVKAGAAQSSISIAVVAGLLNRIEIDPPVAAADRNETVLFTLKGFDTYNNPVPVGSARWSATGGSVDSTGGFTVPATAGVFTVTASAGGRTATATVQPPNFKAASVKLSQPTGSMKANGVSEQILTATVLDAKGVPLTDYQGNLTVTTSAEDVAYPALRSVPVTDGVARITVLAGTTPGTAQIRAATNLTVSGTANVTVAPQRLQSVRLVGAALSAHTDARATGYIEAIALDEDGNPIRTALRDTVVIELTVDFAGEGQVIFMPNGLDSAIVALGAVDSSTGDVRTRTHIQYDPGVGTILIEGTARSPSYVRVLAGALTADQVGLPAKVMFEPMVDTVAGARADVYVVVLDAKGYRVTQEAALGNAIVKLRDQNGVYYPAENDSAEGRWHFRPRQDDVGTYTYTAILQPIGAEASYRSTVIAGDVVGVRLTAEPGTVPADNTAPVVLKAELIDSNGNVVTTGSYEMTFQLVGPTTGALQPFANQDVVAKQGVARLTARAGTVTGATDTVQVTVDNPAGGQWSATATVSTRGVPERLALSYGDNDGNGAPGGLTDSIGQAGRALTVHVDVEDGFGNRATYEDGRTVTLTVRNMETGAENTLKSEKTTDGRATFYVTQTAAGTYALKAQSVGLTMASTFGYGGAYSDLVLRPSHILNFKVAADIENLRPNPNADVVIPNYALITATLVDGNGNQTVNNTGRVVTVVLDLDPKVSANLGTFTIDDQLGGASTTKRSVEIQPGESVSNAVKFFSGSATGSKTVTWKAQDGTTGTVKITTLKAVKEGSLAITADDVTLGTVQTVTVTVKGSDGKRLSSATGLLVLTMEDADTEIVSFLDPETNTWKLPDNPRGHPVARFRGEATFRVRATDSGVKLYQVYYYPADPKQAILSVQGTGIFYAD